MSASVGGSPLPRLLSQSQQVDVSLDDTGRAGRDVSPDARACVAWLRRGVRLSGFSASKWNEDHDAVALHFLQSSEARRLVAYMTGEGELVLVAPLALLSVAPKAFQYWIKRDPPAGDGDGGGMVPLPPQLTMATLRSSVEMGYVNGGGVDALLRVVDGIFMPSLRGGAAGGPTASWPESVRKDFVGQAQRCVGWERGGERARKRAFWRSRYGLALTARARGASSGAQHGPQRGGVGWVRPPHPPPPPF